MSTTESKPVDADVDEMEAAFAEFADAPADETSEAAATSENGSNGDKVTRTEAKMRETMQKNLDKYRAFLDGKFEQRRAKLDAALQAKLDVLAISAGQIASDPARAKVQIRHQVEQSQNRIKALLAKLAQIDPEAAAEALSALKAEGVAEKAEDKATAA